MPERHVNPKIVGQPPSNRRLAVFSVPEGTKVLIASSPRFDATNLSRKEKHSPLLW